VLRWQVSEVAELLDTTVAAVNSALQRARATISSLPSDASASEVDPEVLARYVDAFSRYDMDRLVTLLHDDAIMSMPPFPMWLQGARDIVTFMQLPGPSACANSILLPIYANGCPAFGQYKPDPAGGHAPWALQVLEFSDGRISGFHSFLDTGRIFPSFGLPAHLPE
jgi:RNA polymerase sigma-70 factor (ECF subfamily)